MNNSHYKNNTRRKSVSPQGFTLIELMVSLTIFSIVMMVSVGALLSIIDINAKAQALYSATTNLSFALDSMTREIRTGYHYYCKDSTGTAQESFPNADSTADCINKDFISFSREKDNVQVGYRRREIDGKGVLEQKVASGNWVQITSLDVVVDEFSLTVQNSEPYYTDTSYTVGSDISQPVIDFRLKGYVNNGLDEDTDFNIQSRIVERRLDVI